MYPHQRERLTEVLDREGLEALAASSAASVAYVIGFRSPAHARFATPHLAVFARRGTALVVPADDLGLLAADGTEADHVFGYGEFTDAVGDGTAAARLRALAGTVAPGPGEALERALDALGAGRGRVGLDESALTPPAWEAVAGRLGGRVVPAAGHLLAARRVKSPWELESLERALHMAEEALNAVIQALKPGTTEREAAAMYRAEVAGRGAEPGPAVVAGGDRSWLAAPPPTERPLRPGDLVRLEAGAVFRGYHASVARTAVVGEPDARQQAAADAVQAGLEAALGEVRPGVPAGRLHRAAVEAVRAAGLGGFGRPHAGHGIGLAPREAPELAPGTATPLEMGEVLVIEVPYYEAGWAGVSLRDTALVTRQGVHVMNRSVRGLVVLD